MVQNGSGKGLNITCLKVGGKTGTKIAKVGKKSGKTAYGDVGDKTTKHHLWAIFRLINHYIYMHCYYQFTSNGIYYGGFVAGPVFKEIAEKFSK